MNNLYTEFINFFKKHNLYDEEMFNYIRNNSILIDYREIDKRIFIGCYYISDNDGILRQIKICVPIINNQITTLINIHEYIHAITLYKYLNKKGTIEKEDETLPMLFELLYVLENPNKELHEYLNTINNSIQNGPSKYRIALAVQHELLEYYQKKNPSLKKLQHKAKKLSRKYKVSNT